MYSYILLFGCVINIVPGYAFKITNIFVVLEMTKTWFLMHFVASQTDPPLQSDTPIKKGLFYVSHSFRDSLKYLRLSIISIVW